MIFSKSVPGVGAAAVTSGALIAQQVAGKAARDALFLSSFPAVFLPRVMAVAAVASLVAVVWLSRLMTARSPRQIMPAVFLLSACGLVAEWAVGFVSPPLSAIAVYVHTAVFGPVTLTTFWSLVNERFDPHTAKAAVTRIAAGGTIGGVVGGLVSWRASALIDVPMMLPLLAGLNVACLVGTLAMRAPRAATAPAQPAGEPRPAAIGDPTGSAFGVLRKAPFLRNLAMLVALGAATSSLLDYVLSSQAVLVFAKGAPLLSFFSLFWLSVAVVSFVMQISLGRIAMEKLGLAVNIAVLPTIILMGGAVGLAVPGLLSAALLRGAEAVQRNTLFRSAYELLYTPLPEEQKRAAKALIDVGADRVGTVVGSVITILALRLVTQSAATVLLGVVLFLAASTLPVVYRLHIGYVSALEQGMRAGAKKLALPPLDDAQSSRVEREEGAQRDKLIALVEELRPRTADDAAGAAAIAAGSTGPVFDALRDSHALLSRGAALLSHDPKRARHVLVGWGDGDRPLTGFAILVLAREELHVDASDSLRRNAAGAVGQLVDALLDPAMDFVVRRRLPRVLSRCDSQRAADGLLLGLGDERFEVRYASGRALMKLCEGNATIAVAREPVVAAILREVDKPAPDAATTAFVDDPTEADETSALVDDVLARDRVNRTLEYVFTLLSLHLEREPLRMAFRALHQEDQRHRGTALEYLQTVLSGEIRDAIWPLLGAAAPLRTVQSANEVLVELSRATDGDPAHRDGGRHDESGETA